MESDTGSSVLFCFTNILCLQFCLVAYFRCIFAQTSFCFTRFMKVLRKVKLHQGKPKEPYPKKRNPGTHSSELLRGKKYILDGIIMFRLYTAGLCGVIMCGV